MELELTTCPRCGSTVASQDAVEGLCPSCLLQLGLESDPSRRKGSGRMDGWKRREAPTPELLAPLFPELEILGVLGEGGMGIVYKARQRKLDRLVALKVLRQDIAEDPAFAERFMREARALARLHHPDIVGVHDFGQVGGLYYFVMEYVEGTNLRELLERGTLREEQALSIVPRICSALQYAHDRGVIHRDIKPENILIDEEGTVKIADFSLAKLSGATRQEALTGSNQAMGTVNYMAPEQWKSPLEVDHRADIYSLGVLFYEMLTGELPLGRFALPSQRAGVDARLDGVVLRALEREPELRYQQASELQSDLESIRPDARVGGGPPVTSVFGRSVGYRSQSTLSGWIIFAALFGVLSSSFAPWLMLESDRWTEIAGMRLLPGIACSILFLCGLTVALSTAALRPAPLWRSFTLVVIGFTIFVAVIILVSSNRVWVVGEGSSQVQQHKAGLYLSAIAGLALLAFSGSELGQALARRPRSTVSRARPQRSIVDRLLGWTIGAAAALGICAGAADWARLPRASGLSTWLGMGATMAFLLIFLLRLATHRLGQATWRSYASGVLAVFALGCATVFMEDGALAGFPSGSITLYKAHNSGGVYMALFFGMVVLVASTLEISRSFGREK